MLGDIADLIQIIGLPIAIMAVFLAYREGRRSRDLQAALAFSDAFRTSWERSWGQSLQEAEELARRNELPAGELREELFNILNWLDWVGWLIDADVLARPKVVLSSILPQIRRAMQVVEPIMADDEARHEPGYWHGVRTLQRKLAALELDQTSPPIRPRGRRIGLTRARRSADGDQAPSASAEHARKEGSPIGTAPIGNDNPARITPDDLEPDDSSSRAPGMT